jgi:hypothetical protein
MPAPPFGAASGTSSIRGASAATPLAAEQAAAAASCNQIVCKNLYGFHTLFLMNVKSGKAEFVGSGAGHFTGN